jgi:hypothetical protein
MDCDVFSESFPMLKADEVMKNLMEDLVNTENTVAFAVASFLRMVSEEKRVASKVKFA